MLWPNTNEMFCTYIEQKREHHDYPFILNFCFQSHCKSRHSYTCTSLQLTSRFNLVSFYKDDLRFFIILFFILDCGSFKKLKSKPF